MRAFWPLIRHLAGLLGLLLAGVFGVPASASAVTPTYSYDTSACAYDAPARLSSPDTVATGTRGSPSGPGAVSWMSPVSVESDVDAAKTGDDAGHLVYRIHGNDARKWGHSWTTENPLEMANPRSRLGLPKVNSGENVTCARVCDMGGVRKRDALPLDGNPGGWPEWLFPNPQQQLRELWTIRMEPPL